MKRFLFAIPQLLIVSGLLIMHCSGSAVNLQESYQNLSPQKPVEFPEPAEDNLIVTIANIADERSSYKNRIEFYINEKRIQPNWVPSNLDRKNTYSMRLKPGYYDIQAAYFANVGWGEEKFVISNPDLISILPDQRTLLNCILTKNSNGTLLNKNSRFSISYQPLRQALNDQNATSANLSVKAKSVDQADSTEIVIEKSTQLLQPEKKTKPAPVTTSAEPEDKSIYLQINTVPEYARVFVDDKYVGPSPVRVKVDAVNDHAIQVSREDYQTVVKYVDRSSLHIGTNFLLIELQK